MNKLVLGVGTASILVGVLLVFQVYAPMIPPDCSIPWACGPNTRIPLFQPYSFIGLWADLFLAGGVVIIAVSLMRRKHVQTINGEDEKKA